MKITVNIHSPLYSLQIHGSMDNYDDFTRKYLIEEHTPVSRSSKIKVLLFSTILSVFEFNKLLNSLYSAFFIVLETGFLFYFSTFRMFNRQRNYLSVTRQNRVNVCVFLVCQPCVLVN